MKTEKKNLAIGSIRTISEGGFSAPAYRPARYEIGEGWSEDYTGDNPSAHGNIVRTEEESSGGRQRSVAINGSHVEIGPWGPTKAQRDAHADSEAAKARKAAEAEEDRLAKELAVAVVRAQGENIEVMVRGERKWTRLRDIRDAAADPHDFRLTSAAARQLEKPEERVTRLAYRSLLRHAQALAK